MRGWKLPVASALLALSLCGSSMARADDLVETASQAGSFKTLLTAVKAAGLTHALKADGPFTVFAPTDEAFGKLPQATLEALFRPENRNALKAILTYHVLPKQLLSGNLGRLRSGTEITTLNGEKLRLSRSHGLRVNKSNVVKTDIVTDNGVIHVIDSVLIPPTLTDAEILTAPATGSGETIVDVAAKAGSFKTLLAAVKATGLVQTLKGNGPFTVFAPTDEAFARIPKATLESLLEPENRDKLRALLTYHVVPGKITSAEVKRLRSGARVTTVNGQKLTVRNRRGLQIDDAEVIKPDIAASNGIIHIIDYVLTPEE